MNSFKFWLKSISIFFWKKIRLLSIIFFYYYYFFCIDLHLSILFFLVLMSFILVVFCFLLQVLRFRKSCISFIRHDFIAIILVSNLSSSAYILLFSNTLFSCPITIMKTFVQLMLHFLIGLEVLDDGPTYSGITRLKKDDSFVRKHSWTREAETIATKPLQRRHCNNPV